MTVRILLGDVREKLADLPDESVHCVVTSPPYFGLRDYGVAGQIGLEPTPVEFVAVMVEVFREVRRVLRKDGTCWLNLGDSYAASGQRTNNNGSGATGLMRDGRDEASRLVSASKTKTLGMALPSIDTGLEAKNLLGIPWRVAFALQADGWYLRQDIIWSKPNPMPESVTDRCTKAHEYLFLLSKSARYHYDNDSIRETTGSEMSPEEYAALTAPGATWKSGGITQYHAANKQTAATHPSGRNKRSVWTVPSFPTKEAHFATFPPDLIEPCIKAGCPKDCCAKCGAPVVRETERVDTGRTQKMTDGWDTGDGGHGTIHRDGRQKGEACVPVMASVTTGWSPSCSCDAGLARGTVLDPFGGAGTTGLVADRLQRDAILIELNPEYAAMAKDRLEGDGPLFAEVAL